MTLAYAPIRLWAAVRTFVCLGGACFFVAVVLLTALLATVIVIRERQSAGGQSGGRSGAWPDEGGCQRREP